jgi:lipoate-protein ligase A
MNKILKAQLILEDGVAVHGTMSLEVDGVARPATIPVDRFNAGETLQEIAESVVARISRPKPVEAAKTETREVYSDIILRDSEIEKIRNTPEPSLVIEEK